MNIRDKFIISIIDNNGVRQFNVHRFIKKVLAYGFGFFAIVAVVVFFAIRLLASELKSMQSYKDDTVEKYVEVYNENLNLKHDVDRSQEQLDEINQKIADLEDVISMKNAIVEAKEHNPFDISTLSAKNREMMLKILPNSKPFSGLDINATPQKTGVLFKVPSGTPIIATADGVVDLTRSDATKGIGKFVKIVHTFGFNSIYGHLSKISVSRGDVVRKGQIIGFSGANNGASSLYYDIRFLGSEVNIEKFVAWNLGDFESIMNTADGIVNWDSLLWTFNDMMQISSHKALSADSSDSIKNPADSTRDSAKSDSKKGII